MDSLECDEQNLKMNALLLTEAYVAHTWCNMAEAQSAAKSFRRF